MPSIEEYCRLLDKINVDYTENITRTQVKKKLKRMLATGLYPETYTEREKEILKQVGFPPEVPENSKWDRDNGILANFKKLFEERPRIKRKELVDTLVQAYGKKSYMAILNLIARCKKGEKVFGFKLTEYKKTLFKKKLGRTQK